MKAIILAAGAGRRLGTPDPKCMLRIGAETIIHRQLAAFRAVGVDEFIVVVGHEQNQLRKHLAEQSGRFTYIVNERYAKTNTVYSLYLAREHINDSFFYANADVVFDRRLTDRLIATEAASALAIDVAHCGDEEVKVIVHNHRIMRISKQLDPNKCLGEFVGIAKFGAELSSAFVSALETCVEVENAVNDYFERAVDKLCPDWMLTPIDVSDLPCIEIDFPEDLTRAREEILPRLR